MSLALLVSHMPYSRSRARRRMLHHPTQRRISPHTGPHGARRAQQGAQAAAAQYKEAGGGGWCMRAVPDVGVVEGRDDVGLVPLDGVIHVRHEGEARHVLLHPRHTPTAQAAASGPHTTQGQPGRDAHNLKDRSNRETERRCQRRGSGSGRRRSRVRGSGCWARARR
jgi:hypothetical protein